LGRAVHRAAAFFEEILKHGKKKVINGGDNGDYTKVENRRVVRRHLARERSGFLAEKCKDRDKYRCQVCRMTFEEIYGHIGRDFAEAHHKIPLAKIGKKIDSSLDNLITVCSNCHRMLHQMKGEADDVKRLKRMLRR